MNAQPEVHSARRTSNGQFLFRKGEFVTFITTRPFTLGQNGAAVPVRTEVLFDGTTAEIDGAQYTLSFLRGAIKAGWLVPADEYEEGNPEYERRTRAQIQVRPVNGGNPLDPKPRTHIVTTESDERLVGSAKQHAQRTAANNRGYVRGQTHVNYVTPGTMVRTQHGMMEVEEQDGVELDRSFQTPAGERAKERLDLTSDRASRAMHVAKNAQIQPGEGISEADMLERMDPQDREEYLAIKEAKRSQYVDEPAPRATKALPRPAARKVVATVESKRNGQSEGMRFRNSVGGGTRVGDETDGEIVGQVHGGEDEVTTFEEGGITFKGTNLGRRGRPQQQHDEEDAEPIRVTVAPVRQTASNVAPPPVPANLDVRRKIAKAVCPDFPENYDFTLAPKKKLARLEADYSERTDVLQAVYAAESDDMKALLIQEFPSAFEQN